MMKQKGKATSSVTDGNASSSPATSSSVAVVPSRTHQQSGDVSNQCYVRPFVDVDLNAAVRVNDQSRFFVNVGNLTNARAPLASAAYTSEPNYPGSWHNAGLVDRSFGAGASFGF